MRNFDTGATRDSDTTKYDIDGFLSPFALHRFLRYMHKHRHQADGGLRDSDNWQKGIPIEAYRKSAWRHWFDVWCILRDHPELTGQADDQTPDDIDLEESLCATLFNVQGLLHEVVKARMERKREVSMRVPKPLTCGDCGGSGMTLGGRPFDPFWQLPGKQANSPASCTTCGGAGMISGRQRPARAPKPPTCGDCAKYHGEIVSTCNPPGHARIKPEEEADPSCFVPRKGADNV